VPVLRRKLQAVEIPAKPEGGTIATFVPPSFPNQRLLTVRQAAVYLGCSVWAVRDLIHRKQIPKIRLGKKHLLDRIELDGCIERLKAEGASE
jgi:excisionase family DNA binding protein